MFSIIDLFIAILFLLYILFLCIGYLLGKTTFKNLEDTNLILSNKKSNTSNITKNHIQIDDKKVVTKINTDNLEKRYDELGETKNSSENISSSVSKLKNMKG
jgi:hypothetical protein